MKRPVEVKFYDGILAEARRAWIVPDQQQGIALKLDEDVPAQVSDADFYFAYPDMAYIGGVGGRKPIIELPEERRIEFLSKAPHWLRIKHKDIYHAIWEFERSPILIFFSMIIVISAVIIILKWGIPYSAKQLAKLLPEQTLVEVGNRTEQQLIAQTQPSTLPEEQQMRLKTLYEQKIAVEKPAKIIFRQGGSSMGMNAAAIPNNTIIVTDELVKISGTDEEVLAVLAHEQGHLVQKHSMQKVISNLGAAGLFALVTGDLSDVVTASVVVLTDAGYSQAIELDADDYAMQHLHQQQISSIHLSNFLQRVENARILAEESQTLKKKNFTLNIDGKDRHLTETELKWIRLIGKFKKYLESHPELDKRIERIHAFNEQANHRI
ncbi:M48 family metallopeptidase [Acinetobacter lwoffii]|uniref:M48 family metallopeptidase n=2 Tax=Acinetobacter lwoffii TaxID=28090 RepID=UPI00209B1050|nr:M48 family metallopeptidase [Acinetobacter lwoffii]MCO8080212.1 M48 family metallopeptidase [Acinetobacter lwoffii]